MSTGTGKPVNRYTSNVWHDWSRKRLPRGVVIQDVDDTWWSPIMFGTPGNGLRPAALAELKQSSIPVDRWRPFYADQPNYAALVELGAMAGLPVFVVYFVKDRPIDDRTPLAVFRFDAAVPDFDFERELMTAGEFAERYPLPIIRVEDLF